MSDDFLLRHAGTVALLCPRTTAAQAWVAQMIPNGCIVLDSRQAAEIVAAIRNDGLAVIERHEFERQH